MSTALATTPAAKPSALAIMASRYNVEPGKLLDTLKQTVFKNATDAQLMALTVVANEYGLNPFTKQIYAFPDKGGGIVPVVGVDGWLRIINEHPQFDGMEFEEIREEGKYAGEKCTIYRKDRSRPTVVREYLSECRRNTEPWKMEHRMMRNKVIIQCGRVAFGLSGIFDEDDAEYIAARPANVTRVTTLPAPQFAPAQLPEPTAATPAPAAPPAEEIVPPPEKKAPRTRMVRPPAEPVPPAPVEPLPGAEPEPPAPVAPAEPPAPVEASLAAQLRAAHPHATDRKLLDVLIACRMCEPSTKTLEDVAALRLEQAIGDPETMRDTLSTLS